MDNAVTDIRTELEMLRRQQAEYAEQLAHRMDLLEASLEGDEWLDDVPDDPAWTGPEFLDDRASFDYDLVGNVVTIYVGTLRIPGIGDYEAAKTNVTLTSGSTEWVYVKHDQNTRDTTIEHSATEPISDGRYLRIPLHKFTKTGGVWIHARDCRPDIVLASPIK